MNIPVSGSLLKSSAVLLAAFLPSTAQAAGEGGLPVGEIVSWLLSTLGVVLLIVVLAIGIKKTRIRFSSSGRLEILAQLPLGPKERVVELKAGDRHLLLGVAPGSVRLLCELDADDKAAVFAQGLRQARTNLDTGLDAEAATEVDADLKDLSRLSTPARPEDALK